MFEKSDVFVGGICMNFGDGVDRHFKPEDAREMLAEFEAALTHKDVPVTCNNDRGIQNCGEPVTCLYGSKVTVRDSSSAEHVACWLRIDDSSWSSRMDDEGRRIGPKVSGDESSAHIDVERAKAIVSSLQTWINRAECGDTPFGGLADDQPAPEGDRGGLG